MARPSHQSHQPGEWSLSQHPQSRTNTSRFRLTQIAENRDRPCHYAVEVFALRWKSSSVGLEPTIRRYQWIAILEMTGRGRYGEFLCSLRTQSESRRASVRHRNDLTFDSGYRCLSRYNLVISDRPLLVRRSGRSRAALRISESPARTQRARAPMQKPNTLAADHLEASPTRRRVERFPLKRLLCQSRALPGGVTISAETHNGRTLVRTGILRAECLADRVSRGPRRSGNVRFILA
jgi:hypothetical protein